MRARYRLSLLPPTYARCSRPNTFERDAASDGRFSHLSRASHHVSSSSSVLAQAASISSSYAVLGGGGVLGLENEGSRQDDFLILIFGGDPAASRRLDNGTARSTF